MQASVQCRPQDRNLGMVMMEVDGDLATFLEMRKREKERNGFIHIHNPDAFDDSTGFESILFSVICDFFLSFRVQKFNLVGSS